MHDNTTDIFGCKGFYFTINQPIITTINTLYREPITNTGTGYCTYGRIHSRCISTRSKDTDSFYSCHYLLYLILYYNVIHIIIIPTIPPTIALYPICRKNQPTCMRSEDSKNIPPTDPIGNTFPPIAEVKATIFQ